MKIPVGPLDLLIMQGSSFCNIDCKYCYLPNRAIKNRISLDTVKTTIQKVFDENLVRKKFSLVWHAGEPLAVSLNFYQSVYEVIKKITPPNFMVIQHIQTNAILLTQEWCDFIKEAGIRIGVSIDGPKFIHDCNRLTRSGKGTFDTVMAGVEKLKENNIDFSVIAVLTSASLEHPTEIFNFFKALNPTSVGFNIDEEDGINVNSTIQAGQETKLKNFWKSIYNLQLQKDNYIHIREIFSFNELLVNKDFNATDFSLGQMLCPYKIIAVDTEGNFTTFSPELLGMKDARFGDFSLGNVNTHGFKEVINTPKFKQIFSEIMQGIQLCKHNCMFFNQCGGGAPSNKLYENGSFATTETNYCKYSKKVIVESVLECIEETLKFNSDPIYV